MSETPSPSKKVAADGHEYHVSATANATVAPTNEQTLKNIIPDVGGSAKLEFVTLVKFEYSKTGNVDREFICEEYGYSLTKFDEYINDPRVKAYLMSEGIVPKLLEFDEPDTTNAFKLTFLQIKVAEVMMDLNDTRSVKKKLQDLGLTTKIYQTWLKNPDFTKYLQTLAENFIGNEVQHEAMLALADKVMGGDLAAIKYYHAMTGRYVEQSASRGEGSSYDMQQMIVKIVEIIIDEVDDPQIAATIADRIKGLVIGQQVAGIMASPEIVQPEIATPREMTPKMLALMEKGVGVND